VTRWHWVRGPGSFGDVLRVVVAPATDGGERRDAGVRSSHDQDRSPQQVAAAHAMFVVFVAELLDEVALILVHVLARGRR